MSGFVLHPEALADLEEIWEYIAADNLDAADRVLEELYEAIHGLISFPQQGHRRSDLTARPLRFQSVRKPTAKGSKKYYVLTTVKPLQRKGCSNVCKWLK